MQLKEDKSETKVKNWCFSLVLVADHKYWYSDTLKQVFKKKYEANVQIYSLHGGKRFFLERSR